MRVGAGDASVTGCDALHREKCCSNRHREPHAEIELKAGASMHASVGGGDVSGCCFATFTPQKAKAKTHGEPEAELALKPAAKNSGVPCGRIGGRYAM
jgi:hypothetical protein